MTKTLIKNIEVLTAEDCERVRASIHKLQPLWDDERYRLGAGISYYKPAALYYAASKRSNPILKEHFSWMYEKLLEAFSKAYGCTVKFRDDLAVPGFNIYCGPVDFSTVVYNKHIDLQYLDLNWDPEGSTDPNSTMSFTVPIVSPANGTGLNIWDVTQISAEEIEQSGALDQDKAIYQPYQVGVATIHDGKHYHQMSIAEKWVPTDERITLQGHGLMQNGALVIYG
ncbi:MAG: hypothetical protein JST89_17090 [Cyanobacteria bacterium SZAS-4]|nr:hypothetical protein [Cyanobacteria bacterium SZAS-4]